MIFLGGETMSNPFQKALTAGSVVYIVVGLMLILWPDQARFVVCYALGAAALLYGAYRVVRYFAGGGDSGRFGVALGIACAVLGLFLLFKANVVVSALAAVIGGAVIVESVIRLQLALDIRRGGGSIWLALCISALAMLAFGVVLLFNPITVVRAATIVAGVALALDGLLTLWGILQTKSAPRRTVVVK